MGRRTISILETRTIPSCFISCENLWKGWPKVAALSNLDLTIPQGTLKQVTTPAVIDFSGPHRLFNPLAWQFLFVAGAVLGNRSQRESVAGPLRVAYPIAAVIFVAALVVRMQRRRTSEPR